MRRNAVTDFPPQISELDALPPPPAATRWIILVLLSVAMFGNYYAYDAIAPLADQLHRSLGFTDTQLGTLNAICSLPNIIMVLIGGILVDRIGTRLATLLFTQVRTRGGMMDGGTVWSTRDGLADTASWLSEM